MSEDAEKVSMKSTAFTCPGCRCTSQIDEMFLLPVKRVERDFANGVAIGNAFLTCPVCGKKRYVWVDREGVLRCGCRD